MHWYPWWKELYPARKADLRATTPSVRSEQGWKDSVLVTITFNLNNNAYFQKPWISTKRKNIKLLSAIWGLPLLGSLTVLVTAADGANIIQCTILPHSCYAMESAEEVDAECLGFNTSFAPCDSGAIPWRLWASSSSDIYITTERERMRQNNACGRPSQRTLAHSRYSMYVCQTKLRTCFVK
jgi:hypothetical protein